MEDVQLPSVMATWEVFGGLCIVPAEAEDRVVLVASAHGNVVCWTLAEHMPVVQPAAGLRGTRGDPWDASASGSAQSTTSISQGIAIARCRTLPSVPDLGVLKNVIVCGDAEQFAVGALQHGVGCLPTMSLCSSLTLNTILLRCANPQDDDYTSRKYQRDSTLLEDGLYAGSVAH